MYSPDKLYGFCETEQGERVFFHAEVFERGHWPGITESPLPIIGEEVMVEYAARSDTGDGRAPRARRVIRQEPPRFVEGVVSSFNTDSGWGFALGNDGESYYLHRSEVTEGRLPVVGQTLTFYAGHKKKRPRACHVQMGPMRG